MPKQKKWGVIIGVCLFVAFCSVIVSENDEETAQVTEQATEQVESSYPPIEVVEEEKEPAVWSSDWLKIKESELLELFSDGQFEVEVTSVCRQGAMVTLWVPLDWGVRAAELGRMSCAKIANWLVNNGWDDEITRKTLIARVRVHSREEAGVTGKPRTRQYGIAIYEPRQDNVVWRPTTATTGFQ